MSDVIFFFNDTATTEIYTLSLHDALPIFMYAVTGLSDAVLLSHFRGPEAVASLRSIQPAAQLNQIVFYTFLDRKSTRLNSSHANISYAVFCLKKKSHQQLVCRLLLYT